MSEKGKSKYPELNDKKWLNQKYWVEEVSANKIGEILNCNHHTVTDALRRFGIPERTREEALRLVTQTDEYKEHCSEAHKGEKNYFFGKTHTDDAKAAMSKAKKGDNNPNRICYTDEHKRRISEANSGANHWFFGKHLSDEHREKTSETMKKHWLDPEFVAERMKERNIYPNKLESVVAAILEELEPEVWAYNGNFGEGVMLGGLIPDFVNVNGEKTVIEVFGTYWHSDEVIGDKWKRSEYGRKAVYAQLGYRSIILWEDRINTEGSDYIKEEMEKK